METTTNTPLACNMAAFNAEQGERHQLLARQLFGSVKEIQELEDGYAFHLPMGSSMCIAVAEFITLERLCCPFLNFVLEAEPENGPLRLKLTGRMGLNRSCGLNLACRKKFNLQYSTAISTVYVKSL